MKKKEIINGKIERIEANGLGFFRYQGNEIYVKHVLVGEEVSVRIQKQIRYGYIAELLQVKKPSSIRCKVKCPHFNKCGSCNYLYMLYPFELKSKTEVLQTLTNRSRLKMNVQPIVGMKEPYAYRNKLIISFGLSSKNEVLAGFYEALTHKIVHIESCLLHDEETNKLMKDIIQIVKKSRIMIYDEDRQTGFLRHIVIRENKQKQFMIGIVCTGKEFIGKKNFVKALVDKNPNIVSVIQNVNKRKTSVVLGDEEYVLYGKNYIEDTFDDLKFRISLKSFYQINQQQCLHLYQKAIDLLQLQGNEIVVDTYCGIGTITLYAAKYAKFVYGVEVNPKAIENAIENKRLNNTLNVDFVCEDAGVYMQSLARQKKHVDVLIVDPAREGADDTFLQAVLKLKPKKIVYISCNPETQMRDLKVLKQMYYFKDIHSFDMFPRTSHIESVVLMTSRSPSDKR